MDEFWIYCKLGIEHILNIQGLDHMLFIIVLCAVYKLCETKKITVLITAFTIGHSITLAISSLEIIKVNSHVIEMLIPITIIVTAIFNIFINNPEKTPHFISYNYVLALVFGLIHGMGFSSFFRAMMAGQDNIVFPLLYFNIGIEIGQLAIVIILLFVLFLFSRLVKFNHKYWNLILSSLGGFIALILLIQKLF